jgi:hypothetical protein
LNDDPGIVAEPEDVTPAWLTAVLRHAGFHDEVRAFVANDIGTGQVGRSVRFTLQRTRGNAPASIVGKFASSDPTSRATGIAQQNYFKEVNFYNILLPTVRIRTPRPLYAQIDPESHAFCLMLEDITPSRQGDQIEGGTVEMARLALDQAANLHAPRWNDHTLHDVTFIRPNAALSPEFFKSFWAQLYPGFIARYRSRLSAPNLALLAAFSERLDGWLERSETPFALTHGDFRLDNMLFGESVPLAVVDWQTVAIGHPLADVSYFLGAGLLPEVRRDTEKGLVRGYHQSLCAAGVSGYGFDDCFRDYRRFSFSGLVMAVIASMIVGQTSRGDDMFMAMANRHAEQAIDLGALDLL